MKKTKAKKLQTKCENLWKEIALLRDGRGCQVKKHFPQINTTHSEVMQVDHCFSRSFKRLFTDTSNSTVICRNCNLNKNYNEAIRMAIYDIVLKREGSDIFNRMREQVEMGTPFIEWRHISWLETQVEILTTIRNLYKEGIA